MLASSKQLREDSKGLLLGTTEKDYEAQSATNKHLKESSHRAQLEKVNLPHWLYYWTKVFKIMRKCAPAVKSASKLLGAHFPSPRRPSHVLWST